MSRKKRRHKGERVVNENSNNRTNNAPFGINPAQLMSMLGGNMDMSQIGSMLSSMKMDGLDLNNFNLGNFNNNHQENNVNPGNRNIFDLGALQGMMNNLGLGNFNFNNNSPQYSNLTNENNLNISDDDIDSIDNEVLYDDENIQMLIAIKSIVDPKKAAFIERIIEAYNKGDFK
ncbi:MULTISPECIES: hypothetical protein [Clostridium]|jgi:hypothetical protein|uniref:hypothetical protein n=1 Tax=Clostridium TaxID=1485 RepID=UPI00062E4D69|nr:hypothetical protein [Clostridium sp. C8]KLE15910.1 hypothetical protein AAT22_08960 [Clostridium sp. C8]